MPHVNAGGPPPHLFTTLGGYTGTIHLYEALRYQPNESNLISNLLYYTYFHSNLRFPLPLDANIILAKKIPTVYPKPTFIRAITQATSTSEMGVNIIRTLKCQSL